MARFTGLTRTWQHISPLSLTRRLKRRAPTFLTSLEGGSGDFNHRPTAREVWPSQAGGVRLKCVWTWLPDRAGDIAFGAKPTDLMERVPRAEEVVALIRDTLLPPRGRQDVTS